MKKNISILFTLLLSIHAMAGIGNKRHEKFCATLLDGNKVIVYEGKPLTMEMTLSNGYKIETDGTIIKKDGTKVLLLEGQCISNDGDISSEEENKRD